MLTATHNQNANLVINALALLGDFGLSLLLIPRHVALGAAGATLGAVSVGVTARAAFSRGASVLTPTAWALSHIVQRAL
jgi:O-antigen/teichoic acid export membrane protein